MIAVDTGQFALAPVLLGQVATMKNAAIASALAALSTERPLFHSESDFQHALAWQLRIHNPTVGIRLEVPLRNPRGELDLLILSNGRRIGVELKYARGALSLTHRDERFDLSGKDAKDVTRYGFWNDIARLEAWKATGALDAGFALLLANSPECWEQPGKRQTNHDSFRLHEGAVRSGRLDWRRPPKQHHLWPALTLQNSYSCKWFDYSRVNDSPVACFRYLLLGVGVF